jgi:hypothetical protein
VITRNRGQTKCCPTCGQPLITARQIDGELVRFYPKGALIFDLIVAAGPDGIDSAELFGRIYGAGREHGNAGNRRKPMNNQIQHMRDALVSTDWTIKCWEDPKQHWRYAIVKQGVTK